ncbi:alpha-glucuronidase family glycosyl hydrolase [Oleiagrimonas sp. C23AA]|uniref:alpha-glucuronidase family glycosyl hydrolase n=1 Tax=Oleiagrimonas sp. C23AA TaxID=2719047 RepID=UPI001422E45C|nr:alpha-glucuronidase family glycosyl hydrolase [Oleiagrimonas sp. C23AA]NII09536.1 glucosiduronase [Oleiagrimonas sp. C23AA]
MSFSLRPRGLHGALCAALVLAVSPLAAHAETGADGWLRYAPTKLAAKVPAQIQVLGSAAQIKSAGSELQRGLKAMSGHAPAAVSGEGGKGTVLVGTYAQVKAQLPAWQSPSHAVPGSYQIKAVEHAGHTDWVVAGADARGTLYGAFALLEQLGEQPQRAAIDATSSPSAPIRWVDEWDNPDGSIERGYAGRSIFFDKGHVRADLSRVGDYARLLASVGINGCNVNNVNASPKMLTPQMIAGLARIADAMRPWGVRIAISVDLRSPQEIGGLDTFNPKDPRVIAWWQSKVDALYQAIPDFAGFTVKADSEGQPGPSQYGLSPAAAANMLAKALAPHGGVVMYRAFVYNHHLDWHNAKADRARAAYDIFHPLDGKFDNNVVVQIKNGPIDFQVREPASPLFAGLRKTNQAIELEVTQEYTGQQRQTVYLVPMWKATLDFDMHAEGRHTPVKSIVEGKAFDRPLGGYVAVSNVGLDTNWMRNPLAMANLWGYARLAWNPDLSAKTISSNWTRLTFGTDPVVVDTVNQVLLPSWRTYEDYTGPLGLQTLTNILGPHYGPAPQSQEHNGWGQWFRATHKGVGMDRTVATGTGYIGQYPPQVAAMFESKQSTPDDLMLFMHHVPYGYTLHNGKSVIQTLYDLHYTGAQKAQGFVDAWKKLHGRIDDARYEKVLKIQRYQAAYAIVWRDAVTRYFHKMSGIADAMGRVGHYPDRITGEQMKRVGYTSHKLKYFENASHGQAQVCLKRATCTASATFHRPAGTYNLGVQYFDVRTGTSHFTLKLNGKTISHWTADATLPGTTISGDTSTRHLMRAVRLKPGDTITLVGQPQGGEPAPFDYLVAYPTSRQSKMHD